MQGVVVAYNPDAGEGRIRGSDGRRFAFAIEEWKAPGPPRPGMQVDYDTDGQVAFDVWVMAAASPPNPAPTQTAETPPASIAAAGARPFSRVDGETQQQWTLRVGRGAIAVVTLLGCLLPLYIIGVFPVSLFNLGTILGQINAVFGQARSFGGTTNVGQLSWFTLLGYVLYLVPVAAGFVLLLAAVGRDTRNAAYWHAMAAIVLPIAVPVIAVLSVGEFDQMGNAGSLGFGFFVIVLSGVLQLVLPRWMSSPEQRTQAIAATPGLSKFMTNIALVFALVLLVVFGLFLQLSMSGMAILLIVGVVIIMVLTFRKII